MSGPARRVPHMTERLIDEYISDFCIHQVVHVFTGDGLRRELRTYRIDPEGPTVIELTEQQEKERVRTHALCRADRETGG